MKSKKKSREISESIEYTVDKMKFIVCPAFKTEGNETLKSILTRLIKSEVEKTV
jgi:hypothetical protein